MLQDEDIRDIEREDQFTNANIIDQIIRDVIDVKVMRLRGGRWSNLRFWKEYRRLVREGKTQKRPYNQVRKLDKWDEPLISARKMRRLNRANAAIWGAYAARKIYKRFRKPTYESGAKYQRREDIPKSEPSNTPLTNEPSGGEPINNLKNTMAMKDFSVQETTARRYKMGVRILASKNSGNEMYKSHMEYHMSPVKMCKATSGYTSRFHHEMQLAQGPCLYSSYNYALKDGSVRNVNYNTPTDCDADYDPTPDLRYIGYNTTCYVFAMDWGWTMMNHDTRTQSGDGLLQWGYRTYINTTDANQPLMVSDFIQNKDWKYLTIYKIKYTFDFTNTDPRPFVVEILMFRFKSDADAMGYKEQVLAPFRRQPGGYQSYVLKEGTFWNPEDITIIKRTRILLEGANSLNHVDGTGRAWDAYTSSDRKNTKRHVITMNKTKVFKRPVLATYDALTEAQFFNTYYEPDKGIYCRLQAWPLHNVGYTSQYLTGEHYVDNSIDSFVLPTAAETGTKIMPGVECHIYKKTSFKFDAPRIKTLSSV